MPKAGLLDLEPYPEYKDSGVDWLGEVPAHWDILSARGLFRERLDRGFPSEQLLSVTIKDGVVTRAFLEKTTKAMVEPAEDRSTYKLVLVGDIVYNKMRAWQGAVGVSNLRGIVSPAYIVQRPGAGQVPFYYHQLFRTPAFAKEAERWSYGIASDMWSLRPEHFKMIPVPTPPEGEQRGIARVLDYVEAQLRRLIEAREEGGGLVGGA